VNYARAGFGKNEPHVRSVAADQYEVNSAGRRRCTDGQGTAARHNKRMVTIVILERGRRLRPCDRCWHVYLRVSLSCTTALYQKNKPNLFGRSCVVEDVRLGSLFCSVGFASSEAASPIQRFTIQDLALGPGSVGGASATARVGISRGQHAKQCRATARTTGTAPTTDPGDSPGPFKTFMQRCGLLGFRFVHQTQLPQGETRPTITGPRSTIPLDQGEPKSPPARPSWHR
jgi:hypothetical protein